MSLGTLVHRAINCFTDDDELVGQPMCDCSALQVDLEESSTALGSSTNSDTQVVDPGSISVEKESSLLAVPTENLLGQIYVDAELVTQFTSLSDQNIAEL